MMLSTKSMIDEIINEIKDLPEEQITSILQIIKIFKKSLLQQREQELELKKEFKEWETLSDEAFLNFENSLCPLLLQN